MKRFCLLLLAVALIISTPLLTSCSDSDSENTPAGTTLNFYVMLSHSETNPELYDDKEVTNEMWSLARQTLTQALGGNTTVVVPETEVNTVLDNVKQAFAKLVAETNAKHAYPGLYTFTVKCNEKEITQATFYTPEFWAFTKVENNMTYTILGNETVFKLEPDKNPAETYHFVSTLTINRPSNYSFLVAGDETLVHTFSTVYGETLQATEHDLSKALTAANNVKRYSKSFNMDYLLHGGEYIASVHCDYLEYTDSFKLFITEDPGIIINSDVVAGEGNIMFTVTLTTGYPYNVDDYMNDIVLNATVLKDVDGEEEVVAEVPLTVKLVDNPSHNRVAVLKSYEI